MKNSDDFTRLQLEEEAYRWKRIDRVTQRNVYHPGIAEFCRDEGLSLS